MELTLNDICIAKSSSLKLSEIFDNGKYPVYGASGLCGYLNSYQIDKDAITIVKDGAGIGRVHLLPKESSVLGTMQILIPKKEINILYFYYLIKHMKLGNSYNGATIPHIYFKNYSKNNINVHDYDEQVRISELLSNIEQLITNKKSILKEIDRLIKSRFMCQEVILYGIY